MTKLSPLQLSTLIAIALAPEGRGAYPKLKLNTLESLERRGLVQAKRGVGSISMPHTSIRWYITKSGKELLA